MIEASGLRKTYQVRRRRKTTTVDAVRGVDFSVQRGEIFGFLGPNGAGKTTTLRMLTTLLRPDGGDATIAGIDLRRAPAQVRMQIGFVAQQGGTYNQSNARRDLVHQARMYGASKSAACIAGPGGAVIRLLACSLVVNLTIECHGAVLDGHIESSALHIRIVRQLAANFVVNPVVVVIALGKHRRHQRENEE